MFCFPFHVCSANQCVYSFILLLVFFFSEFFKFIHDESFKRFIVTERMHTRTEPNRTGQNRTATEHRIELNWIEQIETEKNEMSQLLLLPLSVHLPICLSVCLSIWVLCYFFFCCCPPLRITYNTHTHIYTTVYEHDIRMCQVTTTVYKSFCCCLNSLQMRTFKKSLRIWEILAFAVRCSLYTIHSSSLFGAFFFFIVFMVLGSRTVQRSWQTFV